VWSETLNGTVTYLLIAPVLWYIVTYQSFPCHQTQG